MCATSITQIKSMLKHCGLCYNHLLPTAKDDGSAKLRLQIGMVSRSIAKAQRVRKKRLGKPVGTKRALALGKVAVGMLFSAYGATSQSGFNALDSTTRHYLNMCSSMHTGAMRFELLRRLREKAWFRWSFHEKCWRASSDWHKMKKEAGEYSIVFPQLPEFDAMVYHAYEQSGDAGKTFTAADVLSWHIKRMRSKCAKDVFDPEGGDAFSSTKFKSWLRQSFRALLPGDSQEVEALVNAITPHSFRAGLASDLESSNVPRPRIMKAGRWHSERALLQYIRDRLAQRLQRLRFYAIKRVRGVIRRQSTKVQAFQWQCDSSEGYDDDSME